MTKPLFISFEGGEGSGKTTQINRLAGILNENGHKITTTREPGGTQEGEKIRQLLVHKEGGHWDAYAECLMLFAARKMLVDNVIKPAFTENSIVITDRFTDSTRAYQGYARGMDLDKIEQINKVVLGDLEPDLTFILDIDPKGGLDRSKRRLESEKLGIKQTEDKFESLDIDFHQKVREGFLDIARKNKKRCHVIDATRSIDDITDVLKDITLKRLS